MERLPAEQASSSRPVLVHFNVGHRHEIALFRTDTPIEQLKDLFRSAAEASPRDILKLYNNSGLLMNIDTSLPSNTANNPYTLKVVAAHPNDMLLEEVGLDLRALEDRISELEKQLRLDYDVLPPSVQDLKTQVDNFRNKLETTETLSWLGFYKQLPEPLSTEECRRLKYRRKSDSVKKRVKENFFNICESAVTEPVTQWLRMPAFDTRQWEDEELLLLLQHMFIDLDLCSKFAIDITTLRLFLYEVYKNYNDVPFHNFRHCFCVTQMMYAIACYVDLPSKIGDLETLILLVSSICHDLDHPGYNNIYQINAKTELALRYNDISPLENHHCSVAFRVLENEDCNIFKSFTNAQFKQVREGIIRCILATDMARHNEILAQFKDITPSFDYNNKAHINLLCMVLIKVADISNEARPMDVAEPWLDKLLQEFFKQSDAEKLEGLPVTPFMDRDKITKPSSQCSFIGFVLLPLFEALGELLTELQELIVQPVREALEYYRRLNEATKEERMHRKSVVADLIDHQLLPQSNHHHHHHSSHSPDNTVISNGVPKSGSNHSVRSKKSNFQFNRSRSRSTDEDYENTENSGSEDEPCSLADVAEDTESGDSETATEVEVSEKTLKFKISTEGAISSGRKSYPGSRKGSRERGQFLNCVEIARAVQGEKDRKKFIPAGLSFDQKTLMGKKLSFDTSEVVDEHANKYLRQFSKKISVDSESPDDYDKNINQEQFSPSNFDKKKDNFVSYGDSRPCQETFVNKQNNVSANLMMDVCDNSLITEENEVKKAELCEPDIHSTQETINVVNPLSNPCKLDKISVDKSNKTTQGDSLDTSKPDEKQSSPNGNRSFLARLKHFTDRLGLGIDRDSNKFMKNMKFNSMLFKNNNGTRMTLPLRYRNKKENESPCCKSNEIDEEKRASTLPKSSKFSFGNKKSWKQRLLGKGRTTNSLDSIPPESPISVKASTSKSEPTSQSNSPRKELEPRPMTAQECISALEPDPTVLGTSIELM